MKKGIWAGLLSAVVVGAGLVSVFFMDAWIPSGESTITTVSRSTVPANHFLYIADPDGFVLPPWDTYNEDNCAPLQNYFPHNKGGIYMAQEYEDIRYQLNHTISHLIDINEMPYYELEEKLQQSSQPYQDFAAQALVDKDTHELYIKQVSYQTDTGKTRYLDFATDSKIGIYYFQTYEQEPQNLSQNELMEAKIKFQNDVEEMRAFAWGMDYASAYEAYEKIGDSNALARFWSNFLQISNEEAIIYGLSYDEIFDAWMYSGDYEMISHKGILYQVADNGIIRVILMYNPRTDQIEGFCFQRM